VDGGFRQNNRPPVSDLDQSDQVDMAHANRQRMQFHLPKKEEVKERKKENSDMPFRQPSCPANFTRLKTVYGFQPIFTLLASAYA
jgi:hypothetical protein